MGIKQLRSRESKTRDRDLEIWDSEGTYKLQICLTSAVVSLSCKGFRNQTWVSVGSRDTIIQTHHRTSRKKVFSTISLLLLFFNSAAACITWLSQHFFLTLYDYFWTVRLEHILYNSEWAEADTSTVIQAWVINMASSLCSFTIFLQQSSYW